jgi:outer membrane protein TolC
LGPEGESERDAPILSLEKALEIAVHHSPAYQDQKEKLYLSALDLSLARHEFTPIFSAHGTREYLANNGTEITLTPKSSTTDSLVENHRWSDSASVQVDWLIRDLGKISAAASSDFLRFVAGNSGAIGTSRLVATFSRPLLRNASYKNEVESLTQADRNLLYAMRDYTRYRKTFSVEVASAYYNILSSRDMARNIYGSYLISQKNVERCRALASEGRATKSDLGRLEQDELTGESSWVSAVRSYKGSLDDFKVRIGVPVETRLVLDDRDLDQLKIEHPQISVEDSIKVALAARLDLQTYRERQEDADRKVKLAIDALKPQLDLNAAASLASGGSSHYLPGLDTRNLQWSAGASLDPGLDRKAVRNNYRSGLIAFEKAKRDYSLQRDTVELQVRESYRSLEQARRNYEINKKAVELAQSRVEEQQLRAELGQLRAQDQVDAQNSLLDSQNRLTQALVTHTIERLRFWDNMDILYIKSDGKWSPHLPPHALTPKNPKI